MKKKKKIAKEEGGLGFNDPAYDQPKKKPKVGFNAQGAVLDFRPYSKEKQLGKKAKKSEKK